MNSERLNCHPVPCHVREEPLNPFGIVFPRQFNSIVADAALEGGFSDGHHHASHHCASLSATWRRRLVWPWTLVLTLAGAANAPKDAGAYQGPSVQNDNLCAPSPTYEHAGDVAELVGALP
ncbi:MAG: hypothetical protein Q7V17_17695 [Afipia sp.]|nr:hypothetical protein [Afipia sp.]